MIKQATFWEDRKADLEYGKYLAGHKFNVLRHGLEEGAPVGTLLAHDWTKLLPHIWAPYRDWRHGAEGLHGTRNPEVYKRFREAVQEHYLRSPHHWRRFGVPPEKVPLKYKQESLADWYTVGKFNNPKLPEFKTWYKRREYILPFDEDTKKYIRSKLR